MGLTEVVAAASGGVWEFYRDERGISVVKVEISVAGNSEVERAMIRAEVKRIMLAAMEGRLKPYVDLKHLVRNPLLFELRWKIGDAAIPARLWRLYFGWHSNMGPLRVAFKFGEKPRGPEGRAVQDQHIDEAWSRYATWLARTTRT
ncbi:hypothetical protein [Amycolatopsis sp. cmx-4-61]|uniref:hypothetical protein n=1 Tax=Amycolatopsis sp. cmx-4-61 TaxID=2790937 RepID=UPI00397A2C36